jgi:hypothetical protein
VQREFAHADARLPLLAREPELSNANLGAVVVVAPEGVVLLKASTMRSGAASGDDGAPPRP